MAVEHSLSRPLRGKALCEHTGSPRRGSPIAIAALVLILALEARGHCHKAQLDAADVVVVCWGPWQRARAT
jgi:hypothetical protein